MSSEKLEHELEENEAGLSFPERKGRKKSPYRRKQLDYQHQVRPHSGTGGKDNRKIGRILPRIERQLFRRALNKVTSEAKSDEEAALTAADSVRATKRSNYNLFWRYRRKKARLRDSIRDKAKYRTPKRRDNLDADNKAT